MNSLEQLRQYSKVVADTGDFESILAYHPIDATTNPSLIYAAASQEKYRYLSEKAVAKAKQKTSYPYEQLQFCLDEMAVLFGIEILKIVPGRVSTEIDARLSFDIQASIVKARHLIDLYEEAGIDRSRVLIKIASTWEGIKAAEILEKEGIHCNLTLLFSKIQAVACAEAGVTLISPFVGRILDWYLKEKKLSSISVEEDPGVKSVTDIFNYYMRFGYSTEIMAASFRNIDQIIALAGCDLLTISPALLQELENSDRKVVRQLDPKKSAQLDFVRLPADEESFRWYLNEDAMATEKLAEGIRRFKDDLIKLENFIKHHFFS